MSTKINYGISAGTGDVTAAANMTDNAVVRGDGGGKGVQTSIVLIDDSGNLTPATTDVGALGTSSLNWADLFLDAGAVINFDSANYTLTHSAGLLTASGPLSLGTSNALTAGSAELGHASDTTLSRLIAGTLGVEGKTIPYVLAQSAVQASHTGNTSETTLATVTVPANAMGANGSLLIWSSWSVNNDASVKTARIRFNGIAGTLYQTTTLTSTLTNTRPTRIANRNNASSQVGGVPPGISDGTGNSAVAQPTSAVDTTAAVDIVFTGELADGADTISIENYIVFLMYGA